MAQAFKCDRCGAYTDQFDKEEYKFMVWESRSFFKNHINVPIDLCRDCLKDLEKWFDGHPGEGEDDG